MAAYLIVEIKSVSDEATYARYRSRVTPGLEAAGGRYLARGGRTEVLEGGWEPRRIVLVRFDSVDAARRWWESPEYEELKRMRQAATDTNMIIVEGLPIDRGEES